MSDLPVDPAQRNADNLNHGETSMTDFPSLAPLSHDLELLSPLHCSEFSVDDFLLSRTKASDLNFILSDLRTYSEKLKEELFSIINEDYKDFVSLGSNLRAESHRIARLGWDIKKDGEGNTETPARGMMAPVRDTLVASRATLRSVEEDIQACMKRREEAGNHKARLELMLQLHDSIVRLEDLLLIRVPTSQSGLRRYSNHRRNSLLSVDDRGRESFASTLSESDEDLSDYAVSSDYDECDSAADTDQAKETRGQVFAGETRQNSIPLLSPGASSFVKSPNPTESTSASPTKHKRRRRKILRRMSSGSQNPGSPTARRRDSLSPTRTFSSAVGRRQTNSMNTSTSLLGLPQRVARTAAEYSRLRFLSRRVCEEGLSGFSNVIKDRTEHIRSTLRQDLMALLRALLSPASLLVHGKATSRPPNSPEFKRIPLSPIDRRNSFIGGQAFKPNGTAADRSLHELDNWTQVAEPLEDSADAETQYWAARLEEQRSWLEMVLSTLNSLVIPQASHATHGEAPPTQRSNDAEEAVRDLMVQEWATNNINSASVKQYGSVDVVDTPQLSSAQMKPFEESRSQIESTLLPEGSNDGLVSLYNTILRFVAITAWQVCDAAEEVSSQVNRRQSNMKQVEASAEEASTCDVFVNVVWDEISSRLLDEVGSTIFFVGRTDTFYRNFTNTNLFLQRFASLAPSERAREAIKDHPNWSAFKKRWQLPVYFQMRFREVISRLEEALFSSGRLSVEKQGRMKATISTLQAIETLWSDEVHIHELSAREWRVTLQILSRYKSWVEEQTPDDFLSAGGSNAMVSNRLLDGVRTGGPGSDSSRGSMERPRASAEISRVGTPQPPSDQTSQQQEDLQLSLLSSLVSDCLYLQGEMEKMMDGVILSRISASTSGNEDDPSSASELTGLRGDLIDILTQESFDFVPGLISGTGRAVYTILFPRTVEPLRLLRSFSTPTYRGATSSGASSTVQVIQQMFSPIESFSHLISPSSLPTSVRRSWVEKLLSDMFKRYATTIETISKNQQSLNRLKKSQGASSGLLGFFKSSSTDTDTSAGLKAEDNKDVNNEAVRTFETKLVELNLDFDLEGWEPWLKLKRFLESQTEDA